MTVTDDELWPVVLIFTISTIIYLLGGVAYLLGYSVEKHLLNAFVGLSIIIVGAAYLLHPTISGSS